MAKKKTIEKKDAINTKGGTSERDRRLVETCMHNVDLIKQGIRVAALMNKVVGGGIPEFMTAIAMAFGDVVDAMAKASEMSRQKAMEFFFDAVREYVNDDSHFEEEPNINLN